MLSLSLYGLLLLTNISNNTINIPIPIPNSFRNKDVEQNAVRIPKI